MSEKEKKTVKCWMWDIKWKSTIKIKLIPYFFIFPEKILEEIPKITKSKFYLNTITTSRLI